MEFYFYAHEIKGKTDSKGHFKLEGSSRELTTIDPKFNIYHDCNDGSTVCFATILYSHVYIVLIRLSLMGIYILALPTKDLNHDSRQIRLQWKEARYALQRREDRVGGQVQRRNTGLHPLRRSDEDR